MKYQIVAVRDRQQDAYAQPFFSPTTGAAIRAFGDEVTRDAADNQMHRHPEDYALFHLGEYETETGQITTLERPKQLALATDYSQGR